MIGCKTVSSGSFGITPSSLRSGNGVSKLQVTSTPHSAPQKSSLLSGEPGTVLSHKSGEAADPEPLDLSTASINLQRRSFLPVSFISMFSSIEDTPWRRCQQSVGDDGDFDFELRRRLVGVLLRLFDLPLLTESPLDDLDNLLTVGLAFCFTFVFLLELGEDCFFNRFVSSSSQWRMHQLSAHEIQVFATRFFRLFRIFSSMLPTPMPGKDPIDRENDDDEDELEDDGGGRSSISMRMESPCGRV